MQSSFIKQDFMLKINNLINLMEKGSSISNKLNNVGAKLTDIINFINKASNEYSTKYGLVKENRNDINTSSYIGQESPDNTTSNLKKIDVYDSKINIDYDDIPDLNIINTVISQSVFRLLYSIRLQIYYKQLSETSNNHDKNYEKLSKSLNSELKKKKVWVASSTHENEEKFCAKTHIELKKKINNLLTVIIPRHIHRVNEIKKELENLNLKLVLHSDKIGRAHV